MHFLIQDILINYAFLFCSYAHFVFRYEHNFQCVYVSSSKIKLKKRLFKFQESEVVILVCRN